MNGFMKVLRYPWSLMALSISTVFLSFAGYVSYGIYQESRSASLLVFSAIVQRAISESSGRKQSISYLENLTEYNQINSQMAHIDQITLHNWQGDCSLALNLSRLDPLYVPGTFQENVDFGRPKVIVFFYGPVPDISPYLRPENQSELLAPRPEDTRFLSAAEFAELTWVDINDHRATMAAVSDKWSTEIVWRGEQCQTYSYVIFEGA